VQFVSDFYHLHGDFTIAVAADLDQCLSAENGE
jgi:hypothetical protein